MQNIILQTDSYKLNHWNQYPKGTETVYSYFESRPGAAFPYTVFFGLRYILEKYLAGPVVTWRALEEADALARAHFGRDGVFNYEGWKYILQEYNGFLPVKIKAVPEGKRIPTGNVLMTVENTDPNCFWLTNALESLLTHVWYPSTVATLSTHTISMIGSYLDKTGGDRAGLPFMLHDFGYRGASSDETAAIGGAAHLLSSRGTDTLAAMELALDYYEADLNSLAFSVPATEHSVMTSLGEEGEHEIVDQLLEEYPEGIISVVADSYNVFDFVQALGDTFKERIMEREGKFVVRPDSGDPVKTMVDLSFQIWNHFGGTVNEAGYKVFDPHIGLLWGDGIDPAGIDKILYHCTERGFAAENYVFGMGGGLLQKVNRDTQRFAFKCSAQKRNGEWYDVQKNPLDTSKASKAGRLALRYSPHVGSYETQRVDINNDSPTDVLETVFSHGIVKRFPTFEQIRENVADRELAWRGA